MNALVAAGWGALAASSLLIGAWLALRLPLSKNTVGRILGFGAGALLAAIAYELIPKDEANGIGTVISFAAGAGAFFGLDRLISRGSRSENADRSITLGALLDGVPESMVLGMSLAAGSELGIAFFAAVFISNLPESLGASKGMRAEGRSPGRIYAIWAGIAAASAAAAGVGYLLLDLFPGAGGGTVEAFAAGAVLTMLGSSMMPEAYREGGKIVGILVSLGFAVTGILAALE